MNRAVNETLERLRAELVASLDENLPEVTKYDDDPVAFNAKLAKMMAKLKKDAGASAIRQNYKGTGKQSHRRQLYVNIGDAAGVDVWLDSGYVQIGGVLSPPKGFENKKMMGDMTPEQVYQWLSGTLKKMYAGFVKGEALEFNVETTSVDDLKAALEAKKVVSITGWKAVPDMDDNEVVNLAQSLAFSARMAREHKGGISSKESMRWRQSMQRIKDEGLLSDHEYNDLMDQWNGDKGY